MAQILAPPIAANPGLFTPGTLSTISGLSAIAIATPSTPSPKIENGPVGAEPSSDERKSTHHEKYAEQRARASGA